MHGVYELMNSDFKEQKNASNAICIECKNPFEQKNINTLFCSEKCKDNSFDWYISMIETYGDENEYNERDTTHQ